MKGSKAIYESLFEEERAQRTAAASKRQARKGRSVELKEKQNQFIANRYYWYVKIKGQKYEETLAALQDEVYLSVMTITKIIIEEQAHLKMLQKAKAETQYFKKRYPFIVW